MPQRPRASARARPSRQRPVVDSAFDSTVSASSSIPSTSSQTVFSFSVAPTTAPAPRPSLFHSQQFSVTPSTSAVLHSNNSAPSSSTWYPDESITSDVCQTVDPASPRANTTASRTRTSFFPAPGSLHGGDRGIAAYASTEPSDSVDFGTGEPSLSSRARGKRPVQTQTPTTTASFLTPAQLFAHTQALQSQTREISLDPSQVQQQPSRASTSTRTSTQESSAAVPSESTYDDLHGSLHTATATTNRAGTTRTAATAHPPTLSVIIDQREQSDYDLHAHRSPETPSSYLRSRALSSASSSTSTSELAHALQPSGRIGIGTAAHSSVAESSASIPTPTSSSTSSSILDPAKETISGYPVFQSQPSDALILGTALQVNENGPRLNSSHPVIAGSNPIEKPHSWTTTYHYDYSPVSIPYAASSMDEASIIANISAASQTIYNVDTQESPSSPHGTPHEPGEIDVTTGKLQPFLAPGESEVIVDVEAPIYVSPSPESLPRVSPVPSSDMLPSPLPSSLLLPSSIGTQTGEVEDMDRRPRLGLDTGTTARIMTDMRDTPPENTRRDHSYFHRDHSSTAALQITAASMDGEIGAAAISSRPDLSSDIDSEARTTSNNTNKTGFVVGDFSIHVKESGLLSDRNSGVLGTAEGSGHGAGTTSVFSSRPIRADGARHADANTADAEVEEDTDLAPRVRSVHASRGMRACMSVFRLDPFSAGPAAAGLMTSLVSQQQHKSVNIEEGGSGLDGVAVECEADPEEDIEIRAVSGLHDIGVTLEKCKQPTAEIVSENAEGIGARAASKRKARTAHTSIFQYPQAQREQYFQFQQQYPHQQILYHQQSQQQRRPHTQNANTGINDAVDEEIEAITYDGLPARPHSRPARVFVHHLDARTGMLRDGLPPPEALETLPAALDGWHASHESAGGAWVGAGPGLNVAKDRRMSLGPGTWSGPELDSEETVVVGGGGASTEDRVVTKGCECGKDVHTNAASSLDFARTQLRCPSASELEIETAHPDAVRSRVITDYVQPVYPSLPSPQGPPFTSSQT